MNKDEINKAMSNYFTLKQELDDLYERKFEIEDMLKKIQDEFLDKPLTVKSDIWEFTYHHHELKTYDTVREWKSFSKNFLDGFFEGDITPSYHGYSLTIHWQVESITDDGIIILENYDDNGD